MESSSSSSSTHRSGTNKTTSELFICFSSRNNSMKTSSILSPGRPRDPPTTLSNSLSRRLRTSGSIKNGQASPMFPTGGNKRRGSGFENPEPSSPKVTCIGQVRVKTKKQGKKLSRRPSVDMSFRKMEHNQMLRQSSVNSIHHHHQECSSHRNQKWVHLPLTICESLRGFGSEFSCLFPCKSSCFSGEKDERESGSSCVDVFAKWLVAVDDESREIGGGKRRDIELVVDDDDDDKDVVKRRHVFDEIEIKDYDEERGRVSICIPPKNALLLMRCRSDPVKMEALANRFWEPQLPPEDEQQEEGLCYAGEEKENALVNMEKVQVEMEMDVFQERRASVSGNRVEENEVEQVEENEAEQVEENEVEQQGDIKLEVEEEGDIKLEVEVQVNEVIIGEDLIVSEQVQDSGEEKVNEEAHFGEQDKVLEDLQTIEDKALEDLQSHQVGEEEEEDNKIALVEENESSFVTALEVFASQESELVVEGESRVCCCNSDDEVSKPDQTGKEQETTLEIQANDSTHVAEAAKEIQTPEVQLQVEEKQEESLVTDNTQEEEQVKSNVTEEAQKLQQLPDCLLLMMCEPKLSMEVSKETWVCSTDFIRWRPQKKSHAPPCQDDKSSPGNEEQVTDNRISVDSKSDNPFAALPPTYPMTQNQPGRASCCLPAASGVSMATMIEQKLVDAVAYEPFVLTRCKSEPMRTASKLAQGPCFWKNRAMEPHRRVTYGAAGVGC